MLNDLLTDTEKFIAEACGRLARRANDARTDEMLKAPAAMYPPVRPYTAFRRQQFLTLAEQAYLDEDYIIRHGEHNPNWKGPRYL